jgi:hypothetical protein
MHAKMMKALRALEARGVSMWDTSRNPQTHTRTTRVAQADHQELAVIDPLLLSVLLCPGGVCHRLPALLLLHSACH